ncbi:hypothetical protein NliqN6_4847 [Naganishia liquefaciens]|uniref:Uncharacterized protein n=1 Tax=Naganishia liquefaciens TaxID=104408 RepID=A0A8H3TWD4_9TREE|nr:hypothetical protein NliqN6_4847 [Naganishia liquefaciens]
MAYQPFPAPLPSPPAEGHSLPFLPSKRIELIRRTGAFATPPPRRGSWVFSADSDGDSECSDDSSSRRLSSEERVMSIPTIVLTPPQSPVSQFLLSEEDIQSSLNANQRRERLFGFGTRLTGLGEKMGMRNFGSTFANTVHTIPESPSPVARARSVSPPPVSVPATRRFQQQIRYSSPPHNGSPTTDARRASADSFRPVGRHARNGDSISEIICPSPIKINIIPPQPAADFTSDVVSVQSPSATVTKLGQSRPARDGHAQSRAISGDMSGIVSARQVHASYMPCLPAGAPLAGGRNPGSTNGSRSKTRPTPLPQSQSVTFPDISIAITESDDKAKSTHFRAFPEPATSWTRFQGSRTRFKPYLFLLIPLAFVFLHLYYLTVDRQFMQAGHAMVFGKPIRTNDIWISRDAILLNEDFESLFDETGAQINVDQVIASPADWHDVDHDTLLLGETLQNSQFDLNSHQKHRGGHGRWLRRHT